jgi:hypothetical protein
MHDSESVDLSTSLIWEMNCTTTPDGILWAYANQATLLVAEPEPQHALSVRKLVLETGKFNVLTAHSTREAIDLFHLFPNITAAILAGESKIDCDKVASIIKTATKKVPIIYLHGSIGDVVPIQITICPVTNLKLFLNWYAHFSVILERWMTGRSVHNSLKFSRSKDGRKPSDACRRRSYRLSFCSESVRRFENEVRLFRLTNEDVANKSVLRC